ncbi:MAG: hypothetical protein IIA41_08735, partial [SAR324 cluster bacterium]|nr:hypothetical protein [SAR324 cluster bacterium]
MPSETAHPIAGANAEDRGDGKLCSDLEAGGGAIGGVVNVVTRDAAEPETRAAFTVGAFETYEGSLLHSGTTKHFNYSLGYCGFSTEGDFEFARPIIVIDGVESRFQPDRATRINNDREQHAGTLALGTPLFGGSLRFSNYVAYSSGGEPGVDSSNGVTAGQATAARSRDLSNLAQLRWQRSDAEAFFDDIDLMIYHRHESSTFRDPLNLLKGPIDLDTRLSTPGVRLGFSHRGALIGQSNRVDLRIEAAERSFRSEFQLPGSTIGAPLGRRGRRTHQRAGDGATEHETGRPGVLALAIGLHIHVETELDEKSGQILRDLESIDVVKADLLHKSVILQHPDL